MAQEKELGKEETERTHLDWNMFLESKICNKFLFHGEQNQERNLEWLWHKMSYEVTLLIFPFFLHLLSFPLSLLCYLVSQSGCITYN